MRLPLLLCSDRPAGRPWSLLVSLAVITVLAAPSPAASQTARPSPVVPAPAAFVLDNLKQLEAGQSLADWRRARPAGRVEPLLTDHDASYGPWCARVVDQTPLEGAVLQRSAYFYAPSPPESLALPRVPSTTLRNQCRLGLVETAIEFADQRRAEALVSQLQRALDAVLGTRVTGKEAVWGLSASWLSSAWWSTGSASVLTAVAPVDAPARANSLQVLVLAAGPARGADLDSLPSDLLYQIAEPQFQTERLSGRWLEALGLAAVGGVIEADMRALAPRARLGGADAQPEPRVTEPDTVEALEQWLTAAQALPAPRRAAAMLVADLVLARAPGLWTTEEGSPSRSRLGRRGATFVANLFDGGFMYARDWLDAAARLAPGSRAEELAFVTLMEMGFETGGACGDHDGELFRDVIREGARFLATHPASAERARVEMLLGHAYADIVALAHGVPSEYAEPPRYQREEATARARAIEHLHTGLEGRPAGADAAHAWEIAWRLLAGLAPWDTAFFCIND